MTRQPVEIGASLADKRQALRVGAAVLRARWPATQAACLVQIGCNTLDAYAAWQWSGSTLRMHVTLRYTGQLIARSKPGRPTELDESRR